MVLLIWLCLMHCERRPTVWNLVQLQVRLEPALARKPEPTLIHVLGSVVHCAAEALVSQLFTCRASRRSSS